MSAVEGSTFRGSLKLDSETMKVRNWWVRDSRIVGNPLSLYLYLLSVDVQEEITIDGARQALGLGADAFVTATRRLEEAGFLERVERPLSEDDAGPGGNRATRSVRYDFHVLDPAQPESRPSNEGTALPAPGPSSTGDPGGSGS